MSEAFYILAILSVIGAILGNDNISRRLFYLDDSRTFRSSSDTPRIWVAVKEDNSKAAKIKVRFLGNPARELAKDIEIVTDGRIIAESYNGYSYREILESLTKEQLKDIEDLRSFLCS